MKVFLTFCPIFLIKKDKIKDEEYRQNFEKLSDYFWNINEEEVNQTQRIYKEKFFELRRELIEKNKYRSDEYYLLIIGEKSDKNVYIHSFQKESSFLGRIGYNNSQQNCTEDKYINDMFKKILDEIKLLYSYVYIPVEIDAEKFTKVENDNMQKLYGKQLKDEINTILTSNKLVKSIDDKLDVFIGKIEEKLGKDDYEYDSSGHKKHLKESDLLDVILNEYFKIRTLFKLTKHGNGKKIRKRISELSAGEKRQTLIDIVYAFLTNKQEFDKDMIVGIDEPENSLHISLCYEQFEKLKEISNSHSVLVTTHWYGFLPIVGYGTVHYLKREPSEESDNEIVNFKTYDLYNYKSELKAEAETGILEDWQLKSMFDLVQSVFYSVKNNYNWLICEGLSEKIYFEYFLKEEIKNTNLKIIAMGGKKYVSRFYRYLTYPIEYELKANKCGKIACIIDTDNETFELDLVNKYEKKFFIKRLINKDAESKTELIGLDSSLIVKTEIENALNPTIFKEVLDDLKVDEKYKIKIQTDNIANTDFMALRNYDLGDFFKTNDGENKIKFAKKYVEIMQERQDGINYIPEWISSLKEFFNKK